MVARLVVTGRHASSSKTLSTTIDTPSIGQHHSGSSKPPQACLRRQTREEPSCFELHQHVGEWPLSWPPPSSPPPPPPARVAAAGRPPPPLRTARRSWSGGTTPPRTRSRTTSRTRPTATPPRIPT